MTSASSPPLDFGRYVWRPSQDTPLYWKREAGGGEYYEDVIHTTSHGEQFLFLGVKATLTRSVPTTELVAHARAAWTALRFSTPTIAAQTEHNEAGLPLITYHAVQSAAGVSDWAERVVRLAEGTLDLDSLRVEVGKKVIPEPNGDQTFLYIAARSDTVYDFLLYTSHVPFDGAGIKVLFTLFLTKLSLYLDNPSLPSQESFAWGSEVNNLLPCISEVLGPQDARSGNDYKKSLNRMLGDLGGAVPRLYGFKLRNIGPGVTRRVSFTFSENESKRILDAVKARGFTLNHVVHAALTLLCALDNPPNPSTPPDATFVYYGLVDGRPRLAAPYSERLGYPGYALAMTAILVPASAAVVAADESHKQVLLRIASIMKDEYAKQRAFPSLVAIACEEIEIMMNALKTSGTPPAPWTGARYSGDGVGENYLQPVYTDANGASIIKIDDCFVSLNVTEPGPFFRSYSWGGKLTLSADANTHAMPLSDVEGFLKKWVELLRLVL